MRRAPASDAPGARLKGGNGDACLAPPGPPGGKKRSPDGCWARRLQNREALRGKGGRGGFGKKVCFGRALCAVAGQGHGGGAASGGCWARRLQNREALRGKGGRGASGKGALWQGLMRSGWTGGLRAAVLLRGVAGPGRGLWRGQRSLRMALPGKPDSPDCPVWGHEKSRVAVCTATRLSGGSWRVYFAARLALMAAWAAARRAIGTR